MLSPFLLAVVFALVALIAFFAWSGRVPSFRRSPFEVETPKGPGFYERLQVRLRRAGMSETTPGVFLAGIVVPTAGVWILLFLWTGNPLNGIILLPIAVAAGFIFLTLRERSFMRRLSLEMVPFLRRLEAQVRAGRNIQQAFIDAVGDSVLIRQRLEAELLALKLNRPFGEVLRDCQQRIPLRSWSQFIRQIELYHAAGGDIVDLLADTVHQINTLLQLQAELRSEYSKIAKQQYILLFIAIAAFPALAAAGFLGQLTSSVIGLVALAAAIACMAAGVLYGQRQVKDIERKLDF